MKSKFWAILTFIFTLCVYTTYAGEVNVDGGIKFVSQSGAVLRTFPNVSSADYTMYVTADIKNNSAVQKDMILIAAVYDGNNNLKKVLYENISVDADAEKTDGKIAVTIPQGTNQADFVCKAYLWNSVTGDISYRAESVFLDLNTNLYGITIDGINLDTYSDDTNSYSVKVSRANADIKVYPKSGATAIEYTELNVPGTSKIQLTAGNNRREIDIKTYLNDSDLYTLSGLKYRIGDQVYSIDDFDRDTTNYTVKLPDNTFYVKLLPEASGTVTGTVRDVNDSPNTVNGVSYGKMRTDTTGPAYVYEREMIDWIVPIKNENTKAYINVTDGTDTTAYTVTFQCVQPRLTEFNLTGAAGDTYVPVFTQGAGFNNDNGTICAADRLWAAANISKKLIGASYFMSPYNNKGGGQWWNDVGNEGDEYFNFTADTAGTVYYMGGAALAAYSDWEKVNDGIAPMHPVDFTLGDKRWNDYDDTDYFMECIKWIDNVGRCDECGIREIDSSKSIYIDGAVSYKHVFSKHFEAGENVSIKHTGLKGNSAAENIWAVVWDVDVNYPVDGGSDVPGEDEKEKGLVIDLDAADNIGDGILDEFSDMWADLSGNGYNVSLTDACSWGNDALWITTGGRNEANAVLLDSQVASKINSYNFTVEFDLSHLDEGAAIAASKNEKFSICEEGGNVSFYFAGLVRNTIQVSTDEVLSGYNQITVSYDSDNTVTMKWYVDGIEKAVKSVSVSSLSKADTIMLGSYNRLYSGDVAIKKFRVFDYTKTVGE